jgi:multidrug resistance efflux pump
VIEVPVEEGNRLVKKGEVLFKIDPEPYQLAVNQLQAQLATAIASQKELEESLKGARGAVDQSTARMREIGARLELARTRVTQNRELVATGAGSKFDLEQAETNLKELQGQFDAARATQVQAQASERQVQQKLGAKVNGEFAQVAQIRAQLENARWDLEQTVTLSPCDCYVVNLQLRAGGFVAGIPFNAVMTLVEAEGQVVALFNQNELHQVAPGNEAEFTLYTYPGRIIKGTVDSVIWAQGQGQLPPSGTLPMIGVLTQPPGRFAVKFDIADRDKELFMAAGAAGGAAIYTEHFAAIHILRKVILRVSAYINYLILKLH